MGIYDPIELEKHLFDSIVFAHDNSRRLLIHDYYSMVINRFSSWEEYLDFLHELEERGVITGEGEGARLAITWGTEARAWRASLQQAFSSKEKHMTSQTINIATATNVNTAGGDMTITFNSMDAEQLVRVLKEVVNTHPQKEARFGGLKAILESGKDAIAIIKDVVSLNVS